MARKWRKILYEDQGVPDNYVPDTFLADTRRNTFARAYDFGAMAASSTVVAQQLCVVTVFLVAWWKLHERELEPHHVVAASVTTSAVGYLAYTSLMQRRALAKDLATSALLLGTIAFLAPVLKTLTHTVSTDTVHAMTTCLLLAHLFFHDYTSATSLVASQSTSLNSAVFAAVCLASRLATAQHCFATVALALQLFGLWPLLRRRVVARHPRVFRCAVAGVAIALTGALAAIRPLLAGAFAGACLAVTVLAPALLVAMQPQKDNVYGPWDEAVISDLDVARSTSSAVTLTRRPAAQVDSDATDATDVAGTNADVVDESCRPGKARDCVVADDLAETIDGDEET